MLIEDKYPLDIRQVKFFRKRTKKHINYVKNNAQLLATKYPNIAKNLLFDAETHDSSKFSKNEFFAYAWLTSVLGALKYEYPSKELENYVDTKWCDHYKVNPHHPEYWIYHFQLKDMPDFQLAHMVCDWAAMSMELDNSLQDWWTTRASKDFNWSKHQCNRIKAYLQEFKSLN